MLFQKLAFRLCVRLPFSNQIAWHTSFPEVMEQRSQAKRRYLAIEAIECSNYKAKHTDVDRVSKQIMLKAAHLTQEQVGLRRARYAFQKIRDNFLSNRNIQRGSATDTIENGLRRGEGFGVNRARRFELFDQRLKRSLME